MIDNLWLIGPGYMGLEYYRVLSGFGIKPTIIGRSAKPSWPCEVYEHGLQNFIQQDKLQVPKYAIVCVNESYLYENVKTLLDHGVENILVEKPAAINIEQLENLCNSLGGTNVYVGYNRRFYQSVQKCKQLIDSCEGPINITFEFTEWVHKIDFDHYSDEELHRFFLCNSSHVPDTVFYLAGKPKELNTYASGGLSWHPSASVFAGSGITEKDILFNYHANWSSAGRWGIEINLPGKRLLLKPLEGLSVQKKGELTSQEIKLSDIDVRYKPGLYKQVESFLGDKKELCTLKEQKDNFKLYYKMANYKEKTNDK